jgi:Mg-chelatase subunit ChlD
MNLLRPALAALAGVALLTAPTNGQTPSKKAQPPEVEVVFVLDTTGSMGGLIDAAKQKIWSICNQIAAGKPTPNIKVGLVPFRDRGDEYVTKVYDLTDDLDAVHSNLMSFKAKGGGDFPESVNEALFVAVHKINWSKDKQTLRLIFLVGDAPPHMDYKDDVKYPESCKQAVLKDIIINTVQCGDHPETKKYWLDICRLAEGQYVQIGADGGKVVIVETPFDKELAKINEDLTKTTLVFGDDKRQQAGLQQKDANMKLKAPVAADRAAYYGNAGKGASYDLLENIKNKTVKLEDIKKEHLPVELRDLTLKEQHAYLDKLDKVRTDLNNKARELDRKRSEYIVKKRAEDEASRAGDSFDGQVLMLLQRQAGRVQIDYGLPATKK